MDAAPGQPSYTLDRPHGLAVGYTGYTAVLQHAPHQAFSLVEMPIYIIYYKIRFQKKTKQNNRSKFWIGFTDGLIGIATRCSRLHSSQESIGGVGGDGGGANSYATIR